MRVPITHAIFLHRDSNFPDDFMFLNEWRQISTEVDKFPVQSILGLELDTQF